MKEPVIIFDTVSKNYPLYHHITGGIKMFLFNFKKGLKSLKNSRFVALDSISFEIYKGETVGIIGRNGAGKSTILGLIAGVLRSSRGKVIVKGRVSPLLELGAGFHPELSGRENILLNGVLLGLTRAQVASKMEEIVEFSELGSFIEQPIRTYSSGMLARLGFSVVAHLDPEILLVDEILAVGDSSFQAKCMAKIESFRRRGVTIVLVSHVSQKIEKICDRVLWIDDRRIRQIGDPATLIEAYERACSGTSVRI